MTADTPGKQQRAERFERLKHAIWAGLIALVLTFFNLLGPLDQVLWSAQSLTSSHRASGDIVFIGSEEDLADPNHPERRAQLAELVERLDEVGTRRVLVDVVFGAAGDPESDAQLNAALREFSGDAYLVQNVRFTVTDEEQLHGSTASIASGVAPVGADLYKNHLGFAWEAPYTISQDGREIPNIAAVAADRLQGDSAKFPINYFASLASIPIRDFDRSLTAELAPLAGKTVFIGNLHDTDGMTFDVPGRTELPRSIIHVFAAETLKAGQTGHLRGIYIVLVTFLAILVTGLLPVWTWRRMGFVAIAVAVPMTLLITAQLPLRTSAAHALALLVIFGIFRARANWQRSLALIDSETGLPTFTALEGERQVADEVPAIIVAKIHRFEEVRRSLPKELHSEYLLRITARLKAATGDATIYLGQGHMIAWTMNDSDPAQIRDHLEGLRALFSSPLLVGDQQVDVGITFGVDVTASPNVVRRLAAAIAVTEKTNETYDPILIADAASEEDLIWNISLQARIDAALANREIYLAYQPKVMVQTGEIIGVEALVRWNDPVRGNIPPDHFIRQCETSGRMTQLTRYVLTEACKAGNAFADAGMNLPVAVNISATLMHERNIVRMVSEVLQETGFEPRRLTLEITETYRLSNLDLAAEIMGELKALGPKISMDDFGIGAASLEALLRLPFAELKIDRMFVSRMREDAKALGIVKSILQMGRDLRIIIVAEGVEDAATLTLLRDSGCLVAQGFGISRPVDFDKILAFHASKGRSRIQNMV